MCVRVFHLPIADKAWTLTLQGRGKHHIADFMPKEEMEKFFAKVKAIKEGAPFGKFTSRNLCFRHMFERVNHFLFFCQTTA